MTNKNEGCVDLFSGLSNEEVNKRTLPMAHTFLWAWRNAGGHMDRVTASAYVNWEEPIKTACLPLLLFMHSWICVVMYKYYSAPLFLEKLITSAGKVEHSECIFNRAHYCNTVGMFTNHTMHHTLCMIFLNPIENLAWLLIFTVLPQPIKYL